VKNCSRCKQEKSLDDYHKHHRVGTQGYCKICASKENKIKHYKNKYGLTLEEFEELKKKQDYCCAICGEKKKLVVDHDHGTGKRRGIICYSCNIHLGVIENPVKMKKMKEYLDAV